MIINLFIQISSNNNLFGLQFSNVTLRIKGTGTKNVFSSNVEEFPTENYPNIVYINGNKQDTVNYSYTFNQSDNYVELIWNNSRDYCNDIFDGCSDVIEIELRSFDISECKSMFCMFCDCSSLNTLNLSIFNTSQVTNMKSMFWNCSSLTSLNLSNFDTSLVTDMCGMFCYCSSLTSLNLSNFDTSQVTNMWNMFSGCTNLLYIDRKSVV